MNIDRNSQVDMINKYHESIGHSFEKTSQRMLKIPVNQLPETLWDNFTLLNDQISIFDANRMLRRNIKRVDVEYLKQEESLELTGKELLVKVKAFEKTIKNLNFTSY